MTLRRRLSCASSCDAWLSQAYSRSRSYTWLSNSSIGLVTMRIPSIGTCLKLTQHPSPCSAHPWLFPEACTAWNHERAWGGGHQNANTSCALSSNLLCDRSSQLRGSRSLVEPEQCITLQPQMLEGCEATMCDYFWNVLDRQTPMNKKRALCSMSIDLNISADLQVRNVPSCPA